jgi:DNA-binding NarL/FixJ family response regulator
VPPDASRLLPANAQPDIVVVDLDMPGLAASALLAALQRAAPGAAIVTFSGHDPVAVAGDAAAHARLGQPGRWRERIR